MGNFLKVKSLAWRLIHYRFFNAVDESAESSHPPVAAVGWMEREAAKAGLDVWPSAIKPPKW